MKKFIFLLVLLLVAIGTGFTYWAGQPIMSEGEPIEFSIPAGSGVGVAAQQIA
jgi:UPF0755 protein